MAGPDPTMKSTPEPPAGAPRNPLLAVLGAGDVAVAAVARAFSDAFAAAADNRREVQQRVTELPAELEALRGRFSGDELRRALEAYRAQVERAYAALAGRGEETWSAAQGAAVRAFDAAERQARVTGERVEQAGRRLSGRAADAVLDATVATADAGTATVEAVEDAGTATAGALEDVGTDAETDPDTATAAPPGEEPPAVRRPRAPRRKPPTAT